MIVTREGFGRVTKGGGEGMDGRGVVSERMPSRGEDTSVFDLVLLSWKPLFT